MGVKLREKKLKSGNISLYLDIIHNGKRSYEFLNIKISGGKRLSKEDREKKELAEKVRSEREYDLIVRENGVINKKKQRADFVLYFCEVAKEKKNGMWQGARVNLINYVDEDRLTFAEVTPEWILEYQWHLVNRVANNTARDYIKTLNIVLNQAMDDKIIRENPFRDIPKSKRLKKQETKRSFLTFEELQALAKTEVDIPKQSRQIFLFCCFTGLRWGDASTLTWNQILKVKYDGKEQYVIDYQQRKTKAEELLPLSEQARKTFLERKQDAQEESKSKFVFPYARNEGALVDRASLIRLHIKKWCKAAGITKDIKFHSSRHTFATLALTFGADIYTVSKLLGHRDIATTTIYAKIIDKKKNQAVDNLPSFDF